MDDIGTAVEELRRTVEHLPAARLHLLTRGVMSARVPGVDLIVIKPAGAPIDRTVADSVVVTDLSGKVLDGVLAPSSGGDAHAVVYRELPAVRSIVNTRSTLTLAWAARGEPIPHLPTIANGFDGPILVGPYAQITGESVGRGIVDTLSRSPAVLMPGQGLFTVGPDAAEAVRAALLLEQTIRSVHIARQLGTAEPVDPHDLAWLNAPQADYPVGGRSERG